MKAEVNEPVNPVLFKNDVEAALLDKINDIKSLTYETLYSGLKEVSPYVERFFDNVLVMDKDENIKINRMAMLSMLKVINMIADFSALQI